MTPERWQQIKDLFESALACEPGQRAAFLDSVCAGDPELRRDLEALLASHRPAGSSEASTLKTETESPDDRPARPVEARRIGPYKLLHELGHGGMGTVYLAVRADDQYQKRVAIKVVRRGMDSEDTLRRFHNERRIMASLDHPNIAKLFDGGATEDGLPYFVMEYIEGLPLGEYCDAHKLSIVRRLQLFRAACSAVHYAHQNLVVHRDLKPSNILVTAEGVPKLLDFGIAKLLNPELSAQTLDPTRLDLRLMTPRYASPEQIRGESITTASDIYSLGVLLYELLTGHHPYRVTGRPLHEVLNIVCEEDPEEPSTAISRVEELTGPDGTTVTRLTPESVSKTRGGRPERLRRRLRGDLDKIVLMAMRKEPRRRYSSVEHFSEDIRRYLKGLPVIARDNTFAYRSTKFIKRHKAGVLAAALILVTLLVGMAATLWEARIARTQRAEAERRFNDVRQLANWFLFDFHDTIKDLAGLTSARQKLVNKALEYLDSLARGASADLALQREVAMAYDRVGDVQGNPYYANLGNTAGALESYRKALAIRERLSRAQPTNAQTRRDLAVSYDKVGDVLLVTGDPAGALESYRKALAIREARFAAEQTNALARRELAQSYDQIGQALTKTGDLAKAQEHYHKAHAIFEALVAQEPRNVEARRHLALSYSRLGHMRALADDAASALEHYRQAHAIFEALAAEDPTNAKARRDLTHSYDNIGNMLWATNRLAEALESYRQALSIRKTLSVADPTNVQAQRDLAISYGNIGNTLAWMGDPGNAVQNGRQALSIFETLALADPARAEARRDLALAYSNLGEVYATLASNTAAPADQRIERWRQARSCYQQSLDVWHDLRQRGALSGFDAGKLENITGEIAKCDAALAKYGATK